jgi:hypothetical protein
MTAGISLYANEIIDRFLAGEQVQITPETIPPEIMVAEIDRRLQASLLQRDMDTADALNQFKADFLRSLAAGQAPEAAPTGGAAPGPEPIPGAEQQMTEEAATGLE